MADSLALEKLPRMGPDLVVTPLLNRPIPPPQRRGKNPSWLSLKEHATTSPTPLVSGATSPAARTSGPVPPPVVVSSPSPTRIEEGLPSPSEIIAIEELKMKYLSGDVKPSQD